MTLKEVRLTRFIRSRGMAFILAVLSAVLAWRSSLSGTVGVDKVNHGIAFPSPQLWMAPDRLSTGINILLLLLTAFMMIWVNRRFNILRTLSVYFGGLFLVMAVATPPATAFFTGSVLLPILMLGAMSLLLKSFNKPENTRQVLMAFVITGTGALFEYGFLFYVPVLLIGLAQMRIMNLRTLLAALMGLMAPLWIVWGFGLVPLDFLSRLDFRFRLPASLSELPGGYPYLASLLFTLALGVGLGLTNFIKIYAYNARARACNGLLSVGSLFTAVFAVADFMNSTFYILLLDCCVAFQMGHYFRLYAQRRAYVLAIGLMVVYGGFYIWSL